VSDPSLYEQFHIHYGLVPRVVCENARRRIFLEIRRRGVTAEEIREWASNSWFPDLRWEPEFEVIREYLPPAELWGETQILVRLPDEDGTLVGSPHVDDLPPWADGMKYAAIFGVALTSTRLDGGGTILVPGERLEYPMEPGDTLEMSPDLPHMGSPNMSGDIRIALFYRALRRKHD
jgi:hypothetical protein